MRVAAREASGRPDESTTSLHSDPLGAGPPPPPALRTEAMTAGTSGGLGRVKALGLRLGIGSSDLALGELAGGCWPRLLLPFGTVGAAPQIWSRLCRQAAAGITDVFPSSLHTINSR